MKIVDTYNAAVGAIVALLTAILGTYWFLFFFFLLFNVLDWITGCYKARILHTENSKTGWIGAAKKVGYWIIIIVAFCIPFVFEAIGTQIGLNLSYLQLVGWFTLASLMVNEVRSILENLVEAGCDVPPFLIKGLAVTDRLINSKINGASDEDKEVNHNGD